ncbi:MAG: CIA30 family protein [Burkholderiaceae bacterium]|nr:CIA30 family protein [Burkholderiaceae bacterium]
MSKLILTPVRFSAFRSNKLRTQGSAHDRIPIGHKLMFLAALLFVNISAAMPSTSEPTDRTTILENFTSMPADASKAPNAPTSPQDRWEFIADTVMGGVSTGNVQFVTDNGQTVLKLSGTVSTANNGGFIQARLPLDQTAANPLPETAQGIWLKARGNGQKYFVHVRTSGTLLPWQYYQAPFEVTDQWQTVKLAWDDFKPSGGLSGSLLRDVPLADKIKSIAIVAFGRDHEADVEVAEIGYY